MPNLRIEYEQNENCKRASCNKYPNFYSRSNSNFSSAITSLRNSKKNIQGKRNKQA